MKGSAHRLFVHRLVFPCSSILFKCSERRDSTWWLTAKYLLIGPAAIRAGMSFSCSTTWSYCADSGLQMSYSVLIFLIFWICTFAHKGAVHHLSLFMPVVLSYTNLLSGPFSYSRSVDLQWFWEICCPEIPNNDFFFPRDIKYQSKITVGPCLAK